MYNNNNVDISRQMNRDLEHELIQQRLSKDPNDVVITLAIRTPLCKATKGGFKDTPLDTLVLKLLQHVKERMGVDPSLVEDICLGNVCCDGCLNAVQNAG